MRVSSAFLFMKHDGSGLVIKARFCLMVLIAASNISTETFSFGGGFRFNENRNCLARVPRLTA